MRYNDTGTHAIFKNWHGTEKAFPIELLEQIEKEGVSLRELEDLQRFHRLGRLGAEAGKPVAPEVVKIEDLVGVDLTGKVVQFFESNWEDSEWVGSSETSGVIQAEGVNEGYTFVRITSENEEELERFDSFFDSTLPGWTEITIVSPTQTV